MVTIHATPFPTLENFSFTHDRRREESLRSWPKKSKENDRGSKVENGHSMGNRLSECVQVLAKLRRYVVEPLTITFRWFIKISYKLKSFYQTASSVMIIITQLISNL